MTPQIYVACLAAYNNGILHGQWIDAAQDSSAIRAEIDDMLADSPIPDAEEWAVHNYDGLPSNLGEWPDLDQLAQIAEGIDQHGDAFRAYLAWADDDKATVDAFVNCYIGEYLNRADFAEDWLENSGQLADVPEQLQAFINFDAYGRAMLLSGSMVEHDGFWFHND